jgi:hypothetical protein
MVFLLRNKQTKTLMGVSTFSNAGGEFCNDVGAQFQPGGGETLYCVSDMSTARIALERDPCWFNASLEKPQWPDGFDPKQWEIVPVNL